MNTTTVQDLKVFVLSTLEGYEKDFDVDSIVEDIKANHGLNTDVEESTYWEIVENFAL